MPRPLRGRPRGARPGRPAGRHRARPAAVCASGPAAGSAGADSSTRSLSTSTGSRPLSRRRLRSVLWRIVNSQAFRFVPGLELFRRAERLDVGVLDEVLGVGRVPRQAQRCPIQAIEVAQRLGLESAAPALRVPNVRQVRRPIRPRISIGCRLWTRQARRVSSGHGSKCTRTEAGRSRSRDPQEKSGAARGMALAPPPSLRELQYDHSKIADQPVANPIFTR